MTGVRPCRFCVAAWSHTNAAGEREPPPAIDCEWSHRDDQRVYDLARAFAVVFQDRRPTDEQVAWFLEDAEDVVDDFDPAPVRWSVRRLRDGVNDGERGIETRLRINGVSYVALEGGKGERGNVVRLSELQKWEREANQRQ